MTPPSGTYRVKVDLWKECTAPPHVIPYEVTVRYQGAIGYESTSCVRVDQLRRDVAEQCRHRTGRLGRVGHHLRSSVEVPVSVAWLVLALTASTPLDAPRSDRPLLVADGDVDQIYQFRTRRQQHTGEDDRTTKQGKNEPMGPPIHLSAAWIPTAAGVACLAGGGTFYLLARNTQLMLSRGSDQIAFPSELDAAVVARGKLFQLLAWGVGAAGVVGLGLAAWVVSRRAIRSPRHRPQRASCRSRTECCSD